MLTALTIENIVLIDRLDLKADQGLVALTGETGAGKSILLDALGLTLGMRAEASLVRHGSDKASVTACFDLPADHAALTFLQEREMTLGDALILRRTLGKDGRSKAFINDTPVSVQLLKDTGEKLVEIHGQFETQGLLDPATHLATLDAFAGIDTEKIQKAWKGRRMAIEALENAKAGIETLRLQEEYLRHAVAELEDLSPEAGEEEILAQKRRALMGREKTLSALEEAMTLLEEDNGLRSQLARLQNLIAHANHTELDAAMGRALAEMDDLSWQIERIRSGQDIADDDLEAIEERYFALRAVAKKHRVTTDALPAFLKDLAQRLLLITDQDTALADLEKDVDRTKASFISLAEKASAKRQKAAEKLAKAVNAELPDLKLDRARFAVAHTVGAEKNWGPNGMDLMHFAVTTNPQTPPGPLHKIASGGELSRFMLALKVILAETGQATTLIFDEVDSGIGGAAADAVGLRLQRLAQSHQILVVTHSPQVAARAKHHWHVAKATQKGGSVVTRITPLQQAAERTEEIARMLSGAEITAEARAQAGKLLKNKDAA